MQPAAILTLACALLFGQQSLAVTPLHRLRGTIEQVNGDQMTLKTRDGQTVMLALTSDTKYAGLKKSSLDEVQPGDFIGTATKGPPDFMVALEVVVFPESMRGTGEGQYPWDAIPDTTRGPASSGAMNSMSANSMASSTMTNGTVATAKAGPATTNSTMTNGTVASGTASGGVRTITVSYTDPATKQTGTAKVLLPPTAPVVLVQPADKAVARVGAQAFVIASGDNHLTALRVLAGVNGVTPPM